MEWISVKERLPVNGEVVIGFRDLGDMYIQDIGKWDERFWVMNNYTHWMPAPPPPSSHNGDYAKCPNCGSEAKGFKTPVIYHCSNEDCQWSGHFA